jgi:hypothetical protein
MYLRILILAFVACMTISCTVNDEKKYELKSPCVAADSDHAGAPCQRHNINAPYLG